MNRRISSALRVITPVAAVCGACSPTPSESVESRTAAHAIKDASIAKNAKGVTLVRNELQIAAENASGELPAKTPPSPAP